MKKRFLLPVIAATLLLTACGQKNSAKNDTSSQDSSSKVSSSSSSSSSSSEESSSSSSSSESSMPKTSDGITQSKTGDNNNFKVKYSKDGQSIATYTKHTYSSDSEAKNNVNDYQDPSEDKGLPTVDLGYNVTGAKDAGAGQLYINFPIGRWSMTVRGQNANADATTSSAKKIVADVQSQSLPVPNSIGAAVVDTEAGSTTLQWQDGSTVYSMTGNDADTLIKLAASLH